MADSFMTPRKVLSTIYGYTQFRDNQEEIIQHVIAGGNASVLMPTGGGKSLCYQIPALCMEGIGVVVSPLIALMQDQVSALQQLGVKAAMINSTVSSSDAWKIKQDAKADKIKLLYVAPERLLMPDFISFLQECRIALFAIDEAHCISQWGHDFRPEYAQLGQLAQLFPETPRIALTATADEPTRQDIIHKLHLQTAKQFRSGFDRPNIHYSITPKSNAKQQLWQFIGDKHPQDSGIVYCISRDKVEKTAEWLRVKGAKALPYHAGLASAQRASNQQRFLQEDGIIIVATIAFGMGIDKPDVRFVAHLNIPKNIESYYQETGRAGRDGLPANALLIYGMEDCVMLRKWIDESGASQDQKRIEHQKLGALIGICETASCRRQELLHYFGDASEPCGYCDNCDTPPETFDGTIAAQMAISSVYRTGQRFGVRYVIDVLLGKEDERIKRFKHDQQSTFGIGKEFNQKQWQGIFRQLVAMQLLSIDMTGHGGIYITDRGTQFLKQKESIRLRTETIGRVNSNDSKKQQKYVQRDTALVTQGDKQLYNALRMMRSQLAKAKNVPAYAIFADRTLLDIVKKRPTTKQQLHTIHGIGEAKYQSYADELMTVIDEYGKLV
jgi:ATP-dependent DNA helicase RecQ